MSQENPFFKIVIVQGVAKAVGKLPRGIELDGVRHKDFVMREYFTGDLFEAEKEATVTSPLTFNAHLMTMQLESVGDFKGPFTFGMLSRLVPQDWQVLRGAQRELEGLGETNPALMVESLSAPGADS